MDDQAIEARLRWAGLLIAVGLVLQLGVSMWIHPLAFVTFLLVACPFVVAGMLVFLWALVAAR
jgi:hypothetical protein